MYFSSCYAGAASWQPELPQIAPGAGMEEDFGLASFHEFGFAVVRVLPVAQAEALAAVAEQVGRLLGDVEGERQ